MIIKQRFLYLLFFVNFVIIFDTSTMEQKPTWQERVQQKWTNLKSGASDYFGQNAYLGQSLENAKSAFQYTPIVSQYRSRKQALAKQKKQRNAAYNVHEGEILAKAKANPLHMHIKETELELKPYINKDPALDLLLTQLDNQNTTKEQRIQLMNKYKNGLRWYEFRKKAKINTAFNNLKKAWDIVDWSKPRDYDVFKFKNGDQKVYFDPNEYFTSVTGLQQGTNNLLQRRRWVHPSSNDEYFYRENDTVFQGPMHLHTVREKNREDILNTSRELGQQGFEAGLKSGRISSDF